MDKIKNLKDRVENGSILSRNEKDFIKKVYSDKFGKQLQIVRGCKNCYHDALIELLISEKSGEWKMLNGAVIEHKGTIYTKINITQKVIAELLKDDKNKAKFYKHGL